MSEGSWYLCRNGPGVSGAKYHKIHIDEPGRYCIRSNMALGSADGRGMLPVSADRRGVIEESNPTVTRADCEIELGMRLIVYADSARRSSEQLPRGRCHPQPGQCRSYGREGAAARGVQRGSDKKDWYVLPEIRLYPNRKQ